MTRPVRLTVKFDKECPKQYRKPGLKRHIARLASSLRAQYGLHDWDLDFLILKNQGDTQAYTQSDFHYKHATIGIHIEKCIELDRLSGGVDDLKRVLQHEFIHLLLTPFNDFGNEVLLKLPPNERKIFSRFMIMYEEYTVTLIENALLNKLK